MRTEDGELLRPLTDSDDDLWLDAARFVLQQAWPERYVYGFRVWGGDSGCKRIWGLGRSCSSLAGWMCGLPPSSQIKDSTSTGSHDL